MSSIRSPKKESSVLNGNFFNLFEASSEGSSTSELLSTENLLSQPSSLSSSVGSLNTSPINLKFDDSNFPEGSLCDGNPTYIMFLGENSKSEKKPSHGESENSRQTKHADRENRRVSSDLEATIPKLHRLKHEREKTECVSPEAIEENASLDKCPRGQKELSTVHVPKRKSVVHHRGRRLIQRYLSDGSGAYPANHSTRLPIAPLKPKQNALNSDSNMVDPPIIGITCPSPLTATSGDHPELPFPSTPTSLSPGNTPGSGSSLSHSSSVFDIFSVLSLTPSSKSESDETHSPLPPLKGTPKLGRKTLPPLRRSSISPVDLPDTLKSSSFNLQTLVPPIRTPGSSEELSSLEDDRSLSPGQTNHKHTFTRNRHPADKCRSDNTNPRSKDKLVRELPCDQQTYNYSDKLRNSHADSGRETASSANTARETGSPYSNDYYYYNLQPRKDFHELGRTNLQGTDHNYRNRGPEHGHANRTYQYNDPSPEYFHAPPKTWNDFPSKTKNCFSHFNRQGNDPYFQFPAQCRDDGDGNTCERGFRKCLYERDRLDDVFYPNPRSERSLRGRRLHRSSTERNLFSKFKARDSPESHSRRESTTLFGPFPYNNTGAHDLRDPYVKFIPDQVDRYDKQKRCIKDHKHFGSFNNRGAEFMDRCCCNDSHFSQINSEHGNQHMVSENPAAAPRGTRHNRFSHFNTDQSFPKMDRNYGHPWVPAHPPPKENPPKRERSSSMCRVRTQRNSVQQIDVVVDNKCDPPTQRRSRGILARAHSFTAKILSVSRRKEDNHSPSDDCIHPPRRSKIGTVPFQRR